MTDDWIRLSWKVLVVRGVVAIVFGIVAMVWPEPTAITFVLIWGVWALLDGIGSLVHAFQPGVSGGNRVFLALMGVIALVAAFFAILSPGVAAVTLTWILGIWLIVRALFEVAGAFAAGSSTPRLLLFGIAAVDLFLGILFVANPGKAVVGLSILLGITAFAWGVAFVVAGLVVRKNPVVITSSTTTV